MSFLACARKIRNTCTGADTPVEIPMLVLKTPKRIFDTRQLNALDGQVTVDVPAELKADALMVTITAVRPSGKGYVAVGATDPQLGGASCLNFNSDSIANTTAVRLADGKFQLFVSASTHVLVDVVGLI